MRTREAVRIEIRAAEIAQLVREKNGEMIWLGKEMGGWIRAGDNSERKSDFNNKDWQAGWLAAQIWYHFFTDGEA